MADADDKQMSTQVWGSAVVVGSALAVVAAYLIKGAPLVLAVAGAETLLLMVYVARRWRALHGDQSPVRHRPRRGIPDAAHCERCRRAREALDARQARARSAGASRWSGSAAFPTTPDASREPYRESREPRRESHGGQHHAHGGQHHTQGEQYLVHGSEHHAYGEHHHAYGPLQDPGPQSESGGADHPSSPRRPQLRAPYERPWTAERAAGRSVDRSTARRGAPGSAGRAVRHQ
ncbi:hypothetical protein ACFWP2_06195 [Kitasatospora sp. NPDC058444]|uniref:hypothetical protein n=1 Tax=Kitasatospora sp. NPDC058444 TaxID=3346504 RepID=UPI0036676FD0